jgi:hypothetical protein
MEPVHMKMDCVLRDSDRFIAKYGADERESVPIVSQAGDFGSYHMEMSIPNTLKIAGDTLARDTSINHNGRTVNYKAVNDPYAGVRESYETTVMAEIQPANAQAQHIEDLKDRVAELTAKIAANDVLIAKYDNKQNVKNTAKNTEDYKDPRFGLAIFNNLSKIIGVKPRLGSFLKRV